MNDTIFIHGVPCKVNVTDTGVMIRPACGPYQDIFVMTTQPMTPKLATELRHKAHRRAHNEWVGIDKHWKN